MTAPRRPIAWVVNPTDGLPGEGFKVNRYPRLAGALSARGWDVTWITSDFSHFGNGRRTLNEVDLAQPYRIALIRGTGYRPGLSLARLRHNGEFARGLRAWAAAQPVTPGLVIASVPTPEGLAAASEVARRCGAAFVADARDPWPDSARLIIPQRLTGGRPVLRHLALAAVWAATLPMERSVRRELHRADALLAVSETYARWGERLGHRPASRSLVVPLGAALPEACREPRAGRGGVLTVVYVGVLSQSFDWRTVREGFRRASAENSRLRLLVIGDGSQLPTIRAEVAADPVLASTVQVTGSLPHAEVTRRLAASDIGLHPFVATATQSITNKLIDFLMAGLPVVNSQAGEAATLLAAHDAGVTYEAGSPSSLSRAILDLAADEARLDAIGLHARALAEERFEADAVYAAGVDSLLRMLGRA